MKRLKVIPGVKEDAEGEGGKEATKGGEGVKWRIKKMFG